MGTARGLIINRDDINQPRTAFINSSTGQSPVDLRTARRLITHVFKGDAFNDIVELTLAHIGVGEINLQSTAYARQLTQHRITEQNFLAVIQRQSGRLNKAQTVAGLRVVNRDHQAQTIKT